MMYIREFEFVPDEADGGYVALPFGMGGGTQGGTLDEAVAMAVDWLRTMALDSLIHGYELPGGGAGHKPENGGTVIAVAVPVELSDAPSVTAAEAAKMLGVSTARVAQMCSSGQLASWKVGSTRLVALESVELRLREAPKAGRPRREAAMA